MYERTGTSHCTVHTSTVNALLHVCTASSPADSKVVGDGAEGGNKLIVIIMLMEIRIIVRIMMIIVIT